MPTLRSVLDEIEAADQPQPSQEPSPLREVLDEVDSRPEHRRVTEDGRWQEIDDDTVVDLSTGIKHRLYGVNAAESIKPWIDHTRQPGSDTGILFDLLNQAGNNPITIKERGQDRDRQVSQIFIGDKDISAYLIENNYARYKSDFDVQGTYEGAHHRSRSRPVPMDGYPLASQQQTGVRLRHRPILSGRQYFKNAVNRGFDQLQAMNYATAEVIGQALGIDGLQDWGHEGVIRNLQEAALNPPQVKDYTEAEGQVGKYILEALGEELPQLGADLLALVGTGATASAVLGSVGRTALKQMTREQRRQAVKRAAIGGAAASFAAQAVGEVGLELKSQGIEAPGTALAFGAVNAFIDFKAAEYLLRPLFKRFQSLHRNEKLTPKTAAMVVGATGLQGFSTEAITELVQTANSKFAAQLHGGTPFTSEEFTTEYIDAAFKGGIVGGTVRAGTSALGVLGDRVFGDYRDQARKHIDAQDDPGDSAAVDEGIAGSDATVNPSKGVPETDDTLIVADATGSDGQSQTRRPTEESAQPSGAEVSVGEDSELSEEFSEGTLPENTADFAAEDSGATTTDSQAPDNYLQKSVAGAAGDNTDNSTGSTDADQVIPDLIEFSQSPQTTAEKLFGSAADSNEVSTVRYQTFQEFRRDRPGFEATLQQKLVASYQQQGNTEEFLGNRLRKAGFISPSEHRELLSGLGAQTSTVNNSHRPAADDLSAPEEAVVDGRTAETEPDENDRPADEAVGRPATASITGGERLSLQEDGGVDGRGREPDHQGRSPETVSEAGVDQVRQLAGRSEQLEQGTLAEVVRHIESLYGADKLSAATQYLPELTDSDEPVFAQLAQYFNELVTSKGLHKREAAALVLNKYQDFFDFKYSTDEEKLIHEEQLTATPEEDRISSYDELFDRIERHTPQTQYQARWLREFYLVQYPNLDFKTSPHTLTGTERRAEMLLDKPYVVRRNVRNKFPELDGFKLFSSKRSAQRAHAYWKLALKNRAFEMHSVDRAGIDKTPEDADRYYYYFTEQRLPREYAGEDYLKTFGKSFQSRDKGEVTRFGIYKALKEGDYVFRNRRRVSSDSLAQVFRVTGRHLQTGEPYQIPKSLLMPFVTKMGMNLLDQSNSSQSFMFRFLGYQEGVARLLQHRFLPESGDINDFFKDDVVIYGDRSAPNYTLGDYRKGLFELGGLKLRQLESTYQKALNRLYQLHVAKDQLWVKKLGAKPSIQPLPRGHKAEQLKSFFDDGLDNPARKERYRQYQEEIGKAQDAVNAARLALADFLRSQGKTKAEADYLTRSKDSDHFAPSVFEPALDKYQSDERPEYYDGSLKDDSTLEEKITEGTSNNDDSLRVFDEVIGERVGEIAGQLTEPTELSVADQLRIKRLPPEKPDVGLPTAKGRTLGRDETRFVKQLLDSIRVVMPVEIVTPEQFDGDTSGMDTGMYVSDGDTAVIVVPELKNDTKAERGRRLLTIAHELGHALSDHLYKAMNENQRARVEAAFKEDLDSSLVDFDGLSFDETEWFADKMARYLVDRSRKPENFVESLAKRMAKTVRAFYEAAVRSLQPYAQFLFSPNKRFNDVVDELAAAHDLEGYAVVTQGRFYQAGITPTAQTQLKPMASAIRKAMTTGKDVAGGFWRAFRFLTDSNYQLRELGKMGEQLAQQIYVRAGEVVKLKSPLSGLPLTGGYLFRSINARGRLWSEFMATEVAGDRKITDYFKRKAVYKPHPEVLEGGRGFPEGGCQRAV